MPYEPRHSSAGVPDDTPPDGLDAVGPQPPAAPNRSRIRLYVTLGVAGLLALGGLIGGLVATSGGSHRPPSAAVRPLAHAPVARASAPLAGAAHLLERFEFVGPSDSGGFTVPSNPVASYYMYKCPGGRRAFYASMTSANGTDRQTIAKTAGHIGTGSAVLHPKYPGAAYHLAIRTECVYRIQVYGAR